MSTKKQRAYADDIRAGEKRAKNILIEKPNEIAEEIMGLELWEFEVLSGEPTATTEGAYCAAEEIFMSFQGKEMRIYINDEGKLTVYTD